MFEIHKSYGEKTGHFIHAPFRRVERIFGHWELTPSECEFGIRIGIQRRIACVISTAGTMCFISNPTSQKAFETYVVRSKDLMHWESSPLNPVLAAFEGRQDHRQRGDSRHRAERTH